jgi:ABC-type spermidine/putrescine transport system permease subunit II
LRALALIVLFIPQNVLGVLLFSALARLPSTVVAGVPGWILGGLGQAIPAGGLAYLILDAALERVGRPVRLGAVLGASWRQRVQRIVVPLILPALVGCLMVSALVTLDDVIFVRYLPRSGLQTFSTELFSRARYTSSPELAAVCVLLWLVVAAVGLFIPVLGRLLTTPSAISDAVVDNAVAHGPGVASS